MTRQQEADQILSDWQKANRNRHILDVCDEMLIATAIEAAEQEVAECLESFGRLSETKFTRVEPLKGFEHVIPD